MATVLQYLNWAIANGPQFVTALMSVISALIALSLLIPGPQPEKFLQSCLDFLAKFSIKPPDQK